MATADAPAPRTRQASGVSRGIRRVHMYLGLFLAPWLAMYALSTFVMSHRDFFLSFYTSKTPVMSLERQLDYSRTFPAGATPQQIARDVLDDLGLAGTHRVSGGTAGKPLVIDRQQLLAVRRITFDRKNGTLTVQREEFRGPAFLERMHRRRGFQQPYAVDDAWAFTVDLAMIAMVFWALSGLWLWWELRSTRLWGALCAGAGIVLFALFLAFI